MHRLPAARSVSRRLVLPIVAVALVAACGGGAASAGPSSSPKPPVDPTPVIPTESPTADGTYWLRMTSWQAIPPVNLFALTPAVVIDGSGKLIVARHPDSTQLYGVRVYRGRPDPQRVRAPPWWRREPAGPAPCRG